MELGIPFILFSSVSALMSINLRIQSQVWMFSSFHVNGDLCEKRKMELTVMIYVLRHS